MGIFLGRQEKRAPHFFPEPMIPPVLGGDLYGGVSVSSKPDKALQVPTVWACVGLLANAVAMLPLETYRLRDGVPARSADPKLVTTPAAGMTQSEWLHTLMVSLLLRGNAYGRVTERDQAGAGPGLGRPSQVELLSPDLMTVDQDQRSGQVSYKYGPDRELIPFDEVWHVRGLTMPGAKVGLSPISYAAAVLGLDLSSRQFASDFFDGGGIPKAIVTSDQQVTQEQANTIKERILAATRGRQPAVLGAGLKYQGIQVRPEESQFLASQQAGVAQIARFFWVPPAMVGGTEGSSMTYSNREQRAVDFLTYSVAFWLKRIEDAFFPLLPRPQYVRFATAELLRTDAETQAKVDVLLLAGKIVAPSEVRAQRSLPPMTDDQKKEVDMVPLGISPLGRPKGLPGLNLPPGAEAPVPADEQGASGA